MKKVKRVKGCSVMHLKNKKKAAPNFWTLPMCVGYIPLV